MHRRNATLVVIEFGASWPSWQDPGMAGNTAVVAQHYEGEPASLLTQVESRVQRLLAMGWQIHEVVLVSNGRGDLESLSARSLLARRLLAYLRQEGGVSLTLTIGAELGLRATHSLGMLEATLRPTALAADLQLALHVDDREPVRTEASLGVAKTA
jgi:hypothetical protein